MSIHNMFLWRNKQNYLLSPNTHLVSSTVILQLLMRSHQWGQICVCLKLSAGPYIVWVNSNGSGEMVWLSMLAWAFTVCIWAGSIGYGINSSWRYTERCEMKTEGEKKSSIEFILKWLLTLLQVYQWGKLLKSSSIELW